MAHVLNERIDMLHPGDANDAVLRNAINCLERVGTNGIHRATNAAWNELISNFPQTVPLLTTSEISLANWHLFHFMINSLHTWNRKTRLIDVKMNEAYSFLETLVNFVEETYRPIVWHKGAMAFNLLAVKYDQQRETKDVAIKARYMSSLALQQRLQLIEISYELGSEQAREAFEDLQRMMNPQPDDLEEEYSEEDGRKSSSHLDNLRMLQRKGYDPYEAEKNRAAQERQLLEETGKSATIKPTLGPNQYRDGCCVECCC